MMTVVGSTMSRSLQSVSQDNTFHIITDLFKVRHSSSSTCTLGPYVSRLCGTKKPNKPSLRRRAAECRPRSVGPDPAAKSRGGFSHPCRLNTFQGYFRDTH